MRESRLGKARPSGKCELLVDIVLPHPPLVALLLPLVGGEIYIYTHHIQIRDAVLTQLMRSPHPFGIFSLLRIFFRIRTCVLYAYIKVPA